MAKTETKQRRTRVFQKKTLCMLMAGAFAGGLAQAGQFSLDNGVEGTWGLNMSLGTSIRANNADKDLIMRGNGGNAGSSHDDGNLNFDKGDTFSTQAKVVGELGLKKDEFGAFFRVKGWYDYQLEEKGVPFGSSATGTRPMAVWTTASSTSSPSSQAWKCSMPTPHGTATLATTRCRSSSVTRW